MSKEDLVTNTNTINKCCYIDTEKNECDSDNFIIIYYKEDCIYESGFNENNKRNGIKFIINGNKILLQMPSKILWKAL